MLLKFSKLFLLTIFINSLTISVYSQNGGKPGTVRLIQRDGKVRELQIATGIVFHRFDCDSVLTNAGNYGGVTQIIVNPCDTNKTPVREMSNNNTGNLTFSLFPNPTYGDLTIKINFRKQEHINIQLFNVLGEQLRQSDDYSTNENQTTIDWNLNTFSAPVIIPGIYFIRVTTQTEAATQSIVIIH